MTKSFRSLRPATISAQPERPFLLSVAADGYRVTSSCMNSGRISVRWGFLHDVKG